jgi:hypothetical protein
LKAPRGAADAHAALLAQAIKGAIERRICQPPKASWVSQAMAATVINAVTIGLSLRGGTRGRRATRAGAPVL